MFGTQEWDERYSAQNSLTVPNQDIPLGDQIGNGSGFVQGSDRLFRLADGTLLDFKSGRVLAEPKRCDGYWGDPNRTITMDGSGVAPVVNGASRDIPMEKLISDMDRYVGTALPNGELAEPFEEIDPRSAAYWLKAEEEAERMQAEMTDDQKRTLAVFMAHFPKSRLIEESKKPWTGKILEEGDRK